MRRSLLNFPKKTRQLMYGEWVKLNKPGLFADFPNYLQKTDKQKFKSTFGYDGYWGKEENLKGLHKNAYLYYWFGDNKEFLPYKLAIEIDGRQHCTIDCHDKDGITQTACYCMTNHLNADQNIKNLDQHYRKGHFNRVKLNDVSIEISGTCFIVSFKNIEYHS